MTVIQQKIANVASGDCNIEEDILALSDTLYQRDEIAYADIVDWRRGCHLKLSMHFLERCVRR